MEISMNRSAEVGRSNNPIDTNPLDNGLSDPIWLMVDFVLSVAVHLILSFFGIIANIINVIVFVRQDQRETVNISLLALCVADLGYSLTLFWESICVNPYLQKSGIPVAVPDLAYLTAVLPNGVFSRISTLIHVYITLERCLCIAMPLKIKEIFTPNQSITTMAGIYLLSTLSILPMYMSGYLELSINPRTNTTVYVRVNYSNSVFLENIGLVVSAFIIVISYIFDILFTIVIILQLQVKSKWRSQATSSGTMKTKLSTKDRKVIKMILLISVLFIVCTFLNCVKFFQGIIDNFIATEAEVFKSMRAFFFPWSLVLTCEQILHASNIFIYYSMSANYKLLLGKFAQSFHVFILKRNKI